MIAAILLSSFFLISCAAEKAESSENPSIEEVAEEIDELVGEAKADSIEQCAIMPIGVKPAGGPWGYLVYSTLSVDLEKLEKLVSRYNELDEKRNDQSDSFSTADFATEPELTIKDGRCHGEGLYAWNSGEVKENV